MDPMAEVVLSSRHLGDESSHQPTFICSVNESITNYFYLIKIDNYKYNYVISDYKQQVTRLQ